MTAKHILIYTSECTAPHKLILIFYMYKAG